MGFFLMPPVWPFFLYPDFYLWTFHLPHGSGGNTDVLAPLPWPCPLVGCISHFNWYLALLCPVIFSKKPWRCPRIAPCHLLILTRSHLRILTRCSSPRKRNHLQVSLAVREECGLSAWEVGVHFLGIHSNHKKFKFTQTSTDYAESLIT